MNIVKNRLVLSAREYEVLQLVSRGLSYKKIALHIYISPLTVRTHVKNIYRKLGVNNKMEAVNYL